MGKEGLANFCLYGCFSKPPDVVTAAAGRHQSSSAMWVCHTEPLSGEPVRARIRGCMGRTSPVIWRQSRPNSGHMTANLAARTTYWVC
jgi:hypothetical protein